MFAAIGRPTPDDEMHGSEQSLLLTTFRSATPKVLLNVEIGDAAVIERRACGCRFDELGYSQHLHTIRSFRKLTGDGVTFLDGDIIAAIDALVRRFGGGPADYQLVEDQSAVGIPRYALLVSPRLGPMDDAAMVQEFLSALGRLKRPYRFMVNQWQRLGVLSVRRAVPIAGWRGKALPYRTLRQV